MKKILLAVIALCLAGCGVSDTKKTTKNNACGDTESNACSIEESADMSDYKDFTEQENQFITSSIDEVLNLIESKKSAVVYFGYPKCPWCIEALPIINEVAKEKNITVLYVRTRDDDKKQLYSDEKKQQLMNVTSDFLQSDEDGNKQLYVPFVFVIKEGKVIDGHIGTVDGYDTSERKMNDQEKQQLKDIYFAMFSKL